MVGSAVPALLWGVAFANIVAGVPLELQNGNSEFTGNLITLLNPYGLLGGLVTLTLFVTHGAMGRLLSDVGLTPESISAAVLGKLEDVDGAAGPSSAFPEADAHDPASHRRRTR